MTLSVELPWFLFSYEVDTGTERFTQTTAVAWEAQLGELIRAVKPSAHRAIYRLARSEAQERDWHMQVVTEVWAASATHPENPGEILLRLKGEQSLRDGFMNVVAEDHGLSLLYRRPHG